MNNYKLKREILIEDLKALKSRMKVNDSMTNQASHLLRYSYRKVQRSKISVLDKKIKKKELDLFNIEFQRRFSIDQYPENSDKTRLVLQKIKIEADIRELEKEKERIKENMNKPARVCFCGKAATYFLPSKKAIVGNKYTRSSRFAGFYSCGNVWSCPKCSTKISSFRAMEIDAMVNEAVKQGCSVYHLVLTLPHTRNDGPEECVKMFSEVTREFKSGKNRLQTILPGYVGDIKALEVTYNEANGWHVHAHYMIFSEQYLAPKELKQIEVKLYKLYEQVVKRKTGRKTARKPFKLEYARLSKIREEDLKVQGGELIYHCPLSHYIQKMGSLDQYDELIASRRWATAHELTLSSKKVAKKVVNKKSYSLNELLFLSTYSDDEKEKWRCGGLWQSMIQALYRSKQLHFSNNLKARFLPSGFDDLSNEEILEQPDPGDYVIRLLTPTEFILIVRFELYPFVLELVDSYLEEMAFKDEEETQRDIDEINLRLDEFFLNVISDFKAGKLKPPRANSLPGVVYRYQMKHLRKYSEHEESAFSTHELPGHSDYWGFDSPSLTLEELEKFYLSRKQERLAYQERFNNRDDFETIE